MGQHLERHIFEGTGRAMPQLQAVGIPIQRAHRGDCRGVKLLRAIGGRREVGQLLNGELLQKLLHDVNRPVLVGHGL